MLTPHSFPSLRRLDEASKTDDRKQLTEKQWLLIEDLFDWEPPSRAGGRPKIPPRPCLEGLLWLLRNGGRWQANLVTKLAETVPVRVDLPAEITNMAGRRDARRRLGPADRDRRRTRRGRLGEPDRRRHVLSFKKRGECVSVGHKGRGTNAPILSDGGKLPLGVVIFPANESELNHIERLLDSAVVPLPEKARLIYDKAADSDPLRGRLADRGVDLICAHRKNRTKPKTQDGRKLRRMRHRYKTERFNAWFHADGRIDKRRDHRTDVFLGRATLSCLFTILKRF